VPEPEVVLAEELIPVVRRELERRTKLWNEQVGQVGGELAQLSPLTLLAAHSGISERSIWRILNGDSAVVDLILADSLVQALDLTWGIEVPESAIVSQREARNAVQLQTELLKSVARQRGEYVPPAGSKAMRTWAGPQRRKHYREAA
jgi:hypothetical protein